jgi:hypothetical protein
MIGRVAAVIPVNKNIKSSIVIDMRGNGIFGLLSLLCFFLGLIFFPSPLKGDDSISGDSIEDTTGRGLTIRSKPSGVKVFIDGIERGLTPLTLETIRAGEYSVRLSKDGYVDRRFKVTVLPESRLVVAMMLEEARGQVLLSLKRGPGSPPEEILPLSPLITADGAAVQGPVLNLPVGLRTIRVRSFGWEDASATVYVRQDQTRILELSLEPAVFRLSGGVSRRSGFNPGNSGSLGQTEISFEVSAPGRGSLSVRDTRGGLVFFKELGPFRTWSQSVVWDGRIQAGKPGESYGIPLPDGVYTVSISAESLPWDGSAPLSRTLELPVRIDSSFSIVPAALSGGLAGLLFTPVPEILPAGAFQLEANLLFGRPVLTETAWETLPFAASLRFSLLEKLEISSSLNIVPEFNGGAIWGVSGAVKWLLRNSSSRGLPLGIAAGLSYAWVEDAALTPFGMNAGAELFFPFSWHLGQAFAFILSPGIFWTGERGYPSESLPRPLLSGGFQIQRPPFTGGISLRYEYIPAQEEAGPLLLAGEIKFFPPPSNVVFTVLGGAWLRDGEWGAFGGGGIGLLY